MNRRDFMLGGVAAAAWAAAGSRALFGAESPSEREFRTGDVRLMSVYELALTTVRGNWLRLPSWPEPVQAEGSVYNGVWLEDGPQEGAVLASLAPEAARSVARNNHLIFFGLQKPDGQLPYSVKSAGPGFGQIQMVVPIASTAWELAQRWGDEELLTKAYAACARWDAWLMRYRNTRGTGLCEGFCPYDTGMDNSPRWRGVPNSCPDGDARRCPQAAGLPRLCPDLSATVYGGRVALAGMARALGRSGEADGWTESAESIRKLIVERLYDPRDGAFYDLDAQNRFVRVRSTATLRVLGEHVADTDLFEAVWRKQVHDPRAFWAPYPFPSVALDDPEFVRPIPRNSWGGAAQALTALRAPRWMEHYGKPAELAHVMQRWVEAIGRERAFRQQMDPLTGAFTRDDPGGYSPAALVLAEFVWRLSGVRENGDLIEWNVRPPAASGSEFAATMHGVKAALSYSAGSAELRLAGRLLAQVSGVVRLLTTRTGEMRAAAGIAEGASRVTLRTPGRPARSFTIAANERASLTATIA